MIPRRNSPLRIRAWQSIGRIISTCPQRGMNNLPIRLLIAIQICQDVGLALIPPKNSSNAEIRPYRSKNPNQYYLKRMNHRFGSYIFNVSHQSNN